MRCPNVSDVGFPACWRCREEVKQQCRQQAQEDDQDDKRRKWDEASRLTRESPKRARQYKPVRKEK